MDQLRQLEADSIRAFVASCASWLATGRILDYGCGLSPYRDLIAGDYTGYDHPFHAGFVSGGPAVAHDPLDYGERCDAILCTQVIQYVRYPDRLLRAFFDALAGGGRLILTGPTNWPVVEPSDRHRHTVTGITALLLDAGFIVERCEVRAEVEALGNRWPLGYGAVAVA